MNVATRLALLGTLLFFAACNKHQPEPPQTACTDCKWENFVAKPQRVQRIECTNQGKPEHCHLTTENFEPKRDVIVAFDPATGAFNWQLVTPGKPEDRMDCPNLAPDLNDKRVIEGTCIIHDSDHGPAVHFFRATIKPKEEDPTKGRITAAFRHTPFSAAGSDPVHDGHIHLDGDDGGG